MSRSALRSICLVLMSPCASIVLAQGDTARAVRLQEAVRIDARLTEAVWQSAPAVTGLVQRAPNEGQPAPEITEVRFAYDDDALYVGARMFSRDPAAIRALVTRRDQEGISELIVVSLDTYRDRRTAYSFGVTPSAFRRAAGGREVGSAAARLALYSGSSSRAGSGRNKLAARPTA